MTQTYVWETVFGQDFVWLLFFDVSSSAYEYAKWMFDVDQTIVWYRIFIGLLFLLDLDCLVI